MRSTNNDFIYFLLWVGLFITWTIAYSLWKLRFDQAVAEADSTVGGVYSDAISNIFIVKSFALESREQAHINTASELVYRKKKTAWILMFISFAVQGVITFGIELLLVYLMIQKWKTGHFQVGEFVLFQTIMIMLIQRLWEFGRNFRNFFTALADASEMAEVFRQEDIMDVAKKSRSLEFIKALPEQFETKVGERGVKLSGGERQRIAIARAFLEDAPIVVLDEATSTLDSLTEKQIQVAIFELIKNKTAIVIAHRLSTILKMDRIIVLEKGRIIEQGTHQQLLAQHGKYYAMWQHQSGDFLVD